MASISNDIAALGATRQLGVKAPQKVRTASRNEGATEDRPGNSGLKVDGIQEELPVFATRRIDLPATYEPLRDAAAAADLVGLTRSQILGQTDTSALTSPASGRSSILDLLR